MYLPLYWMFLSILCNALYMCRKCNILCKALCNALFAGNIIAYVIFYVQEM